jgi:hypothetical protein
MHEPAWVIFVPCLPLPPTCIFGGPQLSYIVNKQNRYLGEA